MRALALVTIWPGVSLLPFLPQMGSEAWGKKKLEVSFFFAATSLAAPQCALDHGVCDMILCRNEERTTISGKIGPGTVRGSDLPGALSASFGRVHHRIFR